MTATLLRSTNRRQEKKRKDKRNTTPGDRKSKTAILIFSILYTYMGYKLVDKYHFWNMFNLYKLKFRLALNGEKKKLKKEEKKKRVLYLMNSNKRKKKMNLRDYIV